MAELQLPFFPESLEGDDVIDQRQLPAFADTQDNSNAFGSTSLDSVLKVQRAPPFGISPTSSSRLRSFTPQVVIEVAQSVTLKRSRDSTPDPNNRQSRKRNVAPKLRHEDSQIQFEAIESSPITDAVLDSQLLTDRQREVKERQEAEAAMFPDLRSSPRNREKNKPSPISELPLHRSTSIPRETTSPNVERQTTPTLAQAEYDDYVNSSPTPTRALLEESNLLDVPSSPPEAVQDEPAAYVPDETDIPSSPPEMPEENENDMTTSLDPSAQVDPYADENMPTLSTLESTASQQNISAIFEPPAEVDDPKPVAIVDPTVVEEAEIDEPIPEVGPTEIEVPDVETPDTPVRGRENSPVFFETPRSEIFHDSQTSPAISDNNPVDEDVFVDANSSPWLNLDKVNKQQTSSPISYLDESSALRLMEGYDQGSGCPSRTDKENQSQPVSPTSSKNLLQPAITVPFETAANGSKSLLDPHVDEEVDKESAPPVEDPEDYNLIPSLLSLIPETPAPKPTMNLQIVDGEEIDLDETIIVDDSILQERNAPVPRRRGRKRKSDVISDAVKTPAKKGKHEEVAAETAEVNGIQETKPESKLIQHLVVLCTTNLYAVFLPNGKQPSPSKRKGTRGRPKGSRLSSLTRTRSHPSPSQSFSSVDQDNSVRDLQEMEITTEVHASSSTEAIVISEGEVVVEKSIEVIQTMEELSAPHNEELDIAGGEGGEERPEEEIKEISRAPANTDPNASDIEMVADTIIGDSRSLEKSCSASNKPGTETRKEVVSSTSGVITIPSDPVEHALPGQANVYIQTDVVVEAQSVQGLKDKLQSIIGDLRSVTLSRTEMNELEDLFVDAKEQLYGAGRRGRVGS